MRHYIYSVVAVIIFSVNFFSLNSVRPALADSIVDSQVMGQETAVLTTNTPELAHRPDDVMGVHSIEMTIDALAQPAVEAQAVNMSKTAKTRLSSGGGKVDALAM